MKQNNKKEDFSECRTLGASLLGDLITFKGTMRAGEGAIRAGKGTIKDGQDF